MVELSSNFLHTSFILYLIAIVFLGGAIKQKKGINRNKDEKAPIAGKIGICITIAGFISQLGYFITRWIAAGHAPVSNMFEFVTFFSIMFVAGFILFYFLYRSVVLGLFTLPIVLLIIAYGSMFTKDITPLIPSLRSEWLTIHVMTVAAGEGILAISFVAGLIYLIKNIDHSKRTKKTVWLEVIIFGITTVLGFVIITSIFAMTGYKSEINWVNKEGQVEHYQYKLPPLLGPNEWELQTENRMEPLIELPAIIDAQKANTVVWSFLIGNVLYLLVRLITRKRVGQLLQPLVKNLDKDLLDEISYRSVLIGFPVFTLGGLIFAMIWAHIAWSRFWAWDPKEVWALVTWFFYAAFLHLRLSSGWHGEKSAWLAVIGFGIIMFNLIFVNLIIAGMHSYA